MLRADALLSRFGYCSRREAATWIRSGRLCLGQTVITSPSAKVDPTRALVDGEPIPFANGIFIALYKPLGYTCSHTIENNTPTIYELLPAPWSARNPAVQSIGRLDKETSGLLLLSDNGSLVHALTSPRRHVEKVYEYRTSSPVPPDAVAMFASGNLILNGESSPCLPAVLETGCGGSLPRTIAPSRRALPSSAPHARLCGGSGGGTHSCLHRSIATEFSLPASGAMGIRQSSDFQR